MPPSSDKPWQRPKPKWRPTGRRPGGQPGHERKTREPFEPKDVDREVPVLPSRCEGCKGLLHAEDAVGEPVRHQVVDLPKVAALVVEYLLHQLRCRGCGHVTRATLPQGVSPSLVGPRLQAVLAFLTGRCRLSRREAREIVAALFGWKALLSLGMVAKMEKKTSAALAERDEALAARDDTIAARDEALSALAKALRLTEAERDYLRRRLFGKSSEWLPAGPTLFDGLELPPPAPDDEESTRSPREREQAERRRSTGRKPLPESFPRRRIEHPLPDEDRKCFDCGEERVRIGEETSEVLHFVPARFEVCGVLRNYVRFGCDVGRGTCCLHGAVPWARQGGSRGEAKGREGVGRAGRRTPGGR
jgi:transposase